MMLTLTNHGAAVPMPGERGTCRVCWGDVPARELQGNVVKYDDGVVGTCGACMKARREHTAARSK